jgi:hypothetical protein
MLRFPRVVLGYHGCLEPVATELLSGARPIPSWQPSDNRWDWLGKGIYFWEHAPARAKRWAEAKAARTTGVSFPAVVGAVIQLGDCFDLTDVSFTSTLPDAHREVLEEYGSEGTALPVNRGGDADLKLRELDCLVLNSLLLRLKEGGITFDTVRGAFEEGAEAFPGSKIRAESHVQVAVRNPATILGVFSTPDPVRSGATR